MKRQDTDESIPQATDDSCATEGAMELIPSAVDGADSSGTAKDPQTAHTDTPPQSEGSGGDEKGIQPGMLCPDLDLDLHGSH